MGQTQSTITATILGFAAPIERDIISNRTKEVLAKCKAAGIASHLKLDGHKEEIERYLKIRINKVDIDKLVECSPATLYEWLKRNNLYKRTRKNGRYFACILLIDLTRFFS